MTAGNNSAFAARDTKVELHDHRPGLTGSKHMAGHFQIGIIWTVICDQVSNQIYTILAVIFFLTHPKLDLFWSFC